MAKYAIVGKEFTVSATDLLGMNIETYTTDGFECTETEIYETLDEAREELINWHINCKTLNNGMCLCIVYAIAEVTYNQIFERVEEDGEVIEFEYGEVTSVEKIVEYAKK